ncbi:MAG TPA: hypothetical protein VGD80_07890 [Kofleriaceae bacterium]
MTDLDLTEDRIPGLTVGERGKIFGHSYAEQLRLECELPWIRSWAARHGAGLERIRSWLAAGRPHANRAALCISADPQIEAAVREVLAAMPEALACFVVGNVFIVGSGTDTGGFAGEMPLLPPTDRPQLISLPTARREIIAHEIGHTWHRKPLPANARLDAAQLKRLVDASSAQAVDAGRVDETVESQFLRELAADRLATVLGWPCDTTSSYRGAERRASMRAEIERGAARQREREQPERAPGDDSDLDLRAAAILVEDKRDEARRGAVAAAR